MNIIINTDLKPFLFLFHFSFFNLPWGSTSTNLQFLNTPSTRYFTRIFNSSTNFSHTPHPKPREPREIAIIKRLIQSSATISPTWTNWNTKKIGNGSERRQVGTLLNVKWISWGRGKEVKSSKSNQWTCLR